MLKRPTLLLAILVLALALRPSQPAAETAQGGPAGALAQHGRIVGTVTRAGTADPLPEAQIVLARGAATGSAQPATLPARAGGPRASGPQRGGRPAVAPETSGQAVFQDAVNRVETGLWSWLGLPAAAAGRGGFGAVVGQQQRGVLNQLRTITDATGRFIIENIPPGPYTATAQLEGYFGPPIPGGQAPAFMRVNVTIEDGKTTEVDFPLIPGGTITGKVQDARGRAVVDAPVQALRVMYQPDGSVGLQGAGNRTTDDRGEYRLFRLAPGEYYVAANPRNTAAALLEDSPRETQSRTFYPSALSPALSAPILIRGGEEVSGVGIQIRNVSLAKISGRVINALPLSAFDPISEQRGQRGLQQAQQPALAAAVAADPSLQPLVDEVARAQTAVQEAQSAMQEARGRLQEARGLRGAAQAGQRGLPTVQLQLFARDRNAIVDPNTGNRNMTVQLAPPNEGRFELANVPPGSYELFASLPDNGGYGPQQLPGAGTNGRSFGRVSVDVGDTDVSDVTVTVHRGVDVHGRVIVDGHPERLAGAHIVLQPDDASARINIFQQLSRSEAEIAEDGSFTFPAVPEAAYRVQITLGGLGPAARGRGAAGLDQETIQQILSQAQSGGDLQTLLAQARGRLEATAAPPPNAYVADVRMNGASIYDSGLVVGAGFTGLIDVFFQTGPGGIAGRVLGSDQKPVATANVILVPAQSRRRNPDLYRTATTDADGTFTMTGLPPGEFKVFAWQTLGGAPYLNPAFMARYEERGSAVTIFGGGQTSLDVALIPE